MKILKLFWLVIMISAMITGGSALFAQDADEETPADETVGTQTRTPWGMGRRFGMRGFGFRGFVDEDANGLNDYLEDADGDGVVNAHDPDSPLYRDPTTRRVFGRGLGFVDEDGDGINDHLEDADGDGVINVHDPDSPLYRAPGTRLGTGHGFGFVDENGDGINDRLEDSDGDGVVNALDPDSPLYRAPGVRAFTRGGRSRDGMGMERGSAFGGRARALGRGRLGGRGVGAVGSTGETTK